MWSHILRISLPREPAARCHMLLWGWCSRGCPLLSKNTSGNIWLCDTAPGTREICGAGGAGCALHKHVATISIPSHRCIKTLNCWCCFRRLRDAGWVPLAGCWSWGSPWCCKRSGSPCASISPNRAALPHPSIAPVILFLRCGTLPVLFTD